MGSDEGMLLAPLFRCFVSRGVINTNALVLSLSGGFA